jgi:integrase/recombinase XerD
MVLTATGEVAEAIELHDSAAKKCSGRTIPLHPILRSVLLKLAEHGTSGAVIRSERDRPMRASSVVNWFASFYRSLGFQGCSSHSGRRTFITKAARLIHNVGGSLRDVQQLAGHRSLSVTQLYIEGDTLAKRRVVAAL